MSHVIGTNGPGVTIISGRTGQHRSDLGVMVPDVYGTDDPNDAGLIGANGSVGLNATGH